MNFARKLAVFFMSTLFVALLFALPAMVSINRTIGNPDTIKKWLSDSKLYNHAVDRLVEKADETIKNQTNGQGQSNDLSHPEIQAAAVKAFSPEFLQRSTETAIDGIYGWLKGNTDKPEFQIDLSGVKQQFADELNASAKARYASLPLCPKGQPLPSDFDPFEVSCRIQGFNANAEIDRLTSDIANGKKVIGDSSFSGDDLKLVDGQGQQPAYQRLSFLPTLYRLNQLGVLILAVTAFLVALGLIFIYPDRRQGLKKVAAKLITVGALILVSIVLVGVAFGVLNKKLEDKTGGATSSLQQSELYIVRQAEEGINNVNRWFGIGYVVLGAGTLLGLKYVFKAKGGKTAEKPKDQHPQAPAKPASSS